MAEAGTEGASGTMIVTVTMTATVTVTMTDMGAWRGHRVLGVEPREVHQHQGRWGQRQGQQGQGRQGQGQGQVSEPA